MRFLRTPVFYALKIAVQSKSSADDCSREGDSGSIMIIMKIVDDDQNRL
jgi:hypothetical protein